MRDGHNGDDNNNASGIGEERLFVGTAEAEHVEMYLKAIWHIKERGGEVKITSIAEMLHVKQPSVVQMLKKLNGKKLVNYNKAGVRLTSEGEKIGASMMRNSRLLEVLMKSALKVEINEEMVCGIEHHMDKRFTNALCTMLNHPRKSPRGLDIPVGECCLQESRKDGEGDGDGGGDNNDSSGDEEGTKWRRQPSASSATAHARGRQDSSS